MVLTDVTMQEVDGQLQISPPTSNAVMHTGPSSAGTVGTFYAFTDPTIAIAMLGDGPLVSAMLNTLAENGIAFGMPATKTNGSQAAWVLTGTSHSVMSSSGTPNDDYQVRTKVVKAGARGTAQVAFSLDAGRTYGLPITTAATYAGLAAKTGLTFAWTAVDGGDFVLNDIWSSDSTGPTCSTSAIDTAIDSVFADPREWGMLHVASKPGDATAMTDMAAKVDAKLSTAATSKFRYERGIVDGADLTDGQLITAATPLALPRAMIGGGYCLLEEQSPGSYQFKRPVSWPIVSRIAKKRLQEHPGKKKLGPLPSWVKAILRDEYATPGLDDARYATLRTRAGLSGFWIEKGNTLAPAGSDYGAIQRAQVIDYSARISRQALLEFLNDDLVLNDDGTLEENQAGSIDKFVEAEVRAAVIQEGYALKVKCTTSRTNNVQSTDTLKGKVRVRLKGYAQYITFDIGAQAKA